MSEKSGPAAAPCKTEAGKAKADQQKRRRRSGDRLTDGELISATAIETAGRQEVCTVYIAVITIPGTIRGISSVKGIVDDQRRLRGAGQAGHRRAKRQ